MFFIFLINMVPTYIADEDYYWSANAFDDQPNEFQVQSPNAKMQSVYKKYVARTSQKTTWF